MNASTPSDLPALPEMQHGRYRHYKGGMYEVIGVARHSETGAALVVYRPLQPGADWWVRPHEMFQQTVDVNGVATPRFEFVAPM